MDNNEIMARSSTSLYPLHLQKDGGSLWVHENLSEINQFIVGTDGKTGIGENAPDSKLNINASSGENALRIEVGGITKLLLSSNGGVSLFNASSPVFALELQNSSADLYGRARAYSWNTYSDDRLKSKQEELEYGIKEVMQLQPKSYLHHSSEIQEDGTYVMVGSHTISTIGFIAQEVQQHIPEAVNQPEDESNNLWSMDYNKLIPVLTKAIQEQQAMIENMQQEIQTLKDQMKE